MAKNVCPGGAQKITVENRNCPNCGYETEVFSDETEIKCSKCRHKFSKKDIEEKKGKEGTKV